MGCCCGKYEQPKEIKSKHWPTFFASLPKMEGKVVAVTGCTSGTGFICAKACAQLGAQVVMLNRASERATKAEEQLRSEVPDAKVTTISCDLQKFEAVRKAAEMLKEQFGETGLDVLCNNAGVMALADEATADGCDVQMQTNHLSHFLLTCEVWPLLDKAASFRGEARVVNHTSIARTGAPLEKKYLGKNGGNLGGNSSSINNGARWVRYHQSKLANAVFTYALRDRAQAANSKVKALMAHPGVSATNLQVTTIQDKGMSSGMANMIVSQSAEDGAIGLTLCCCQPEVKSGEFYGPKGRGLSGMAVLLPAGPEEKLANEASRNMLWEESQLSTGATFTIPAA
eukprot:CAMPEP_0171064758 /NCGR_PEP_ID=MMETSP0766_2-20121228/6478_1 /TAXON_ID=439317 /ORGANISM="Gambierdiscus australes, Strain CAWD 149" /LENGTH=341 /DNA_ID=CAMNT_0011520823 /DNA_START=51 /DNA_END=1076 /DNA_ORIENTATION=+